jgi:hypothetical protein
MPLMNDIRQLSVVVVTVVLGRLSYGDNIMELKVTGFVSLIHEPFVQLWKTIKRMVGMWLSLEV